MTSIKKRQASTRVLTAEILDMVTGGIKPTVSELVDRLREEIDVRPGEILTTLNNLLKEGQIKIEFCKVDLADPESLITVKIDCSN